jgi:hypothetical protein
MRRNDRVAVLAGRNRRQQMCGSGQGPREMFQRQIVVERESFPPEACHGLPRVGVAACPGYTPFGGCQMAGQCLCSIAQSKAEQIVFHNFFAFTGCS